MTDKNQTSEQLIEGCKRYVKEYFELNSAPQYTYHNWEHSLSVLEAVEEITKATPSIDATQVEQLRLAAIFHDATYAQDPSKHEENSAQLAEEQLLEREVPRDFVQEVKRIIMATKKQHQAQDLLEEVIRDADLAHLGKESYMQVSFEDLSNEMKKSHCPEMTDLEWTKACIQFLNDHEYKTEYAKKNYTDNKNKNLEKLRIMEEKLSAQTIENKDEGKAPLSKKKAKKKKDENPLKGVETMFKTALRNHVDLSSIADKKANTLISVNAIIISIVLSALFPKLDSNPFMFYPGVTILISCFLTILLAILSTIPNISRGSIGKDQVKAEKGNLLFLGNFYKMKLEDYEWSINQLMKSKNYIYNSMTRDLYFLGKVLNKKYMLLRWSYYVFILGLLSSIIVFILKVLPVIGTSVDLPIE